MQFCQEVLTYLTLLGGKQPLQQILTWNSSASNDCETMSFIAHLVLKHSESRPSFDFNLITRQIKVEIGRNYFHILVRNPRKTTSYIKQIESKRWQIPMWRLSSLKCRTEHEDCNETWRKTHGNWDKTFVFFQ